MPEDNSTIIAKAIQEGNEEVFKAFFRAEFHNIRFFVNKYLNNFFDAQDIAQETFITLWDVRRQINPSLNIRSYTHTIAKNKALNFLRDTTKARTGTLSAEENAINRFALSHPSVSEQIEALELEQQINRVYSLLPEKCRESFILNRKYGFTYDEIAKKKGISVKAVEYQIVSAMRVFKNKITLFISR